MDPDKYKELQDEYVELYHKVMNYRVQKPKRISPGVSWTTSEMRKINDRQDEILDIVASEALREFIRSIDDRL